MLYYTRERECNLLWRVENEALLPIITACYISTNNFVATAGMLVAGAIALRFPRGAMSSLQASHWIPFRDL